MSKQAIMTAVGKPIVVLGDVMTDIIVKVTDPLSIGSDTAAKCHLIAGGSGANQAAWLATKGLDVHFIGCVGDDTFGRAHLRALSNAGITPHLGIDQRLGTGMIIVLVGANGERTMITDRGANGGLKRQHLPLEVFQSPNWFHLSGYMLLAPETREVALAALQLAREQGMPISIDPSSTAPLAAADPKLFVEWTRGADLCFPNFDEGRLLTGESDEASVARALCQWYGGVALKLGRQGALFAVAGEPIFRQSQLGEPGEAVDTTGAGDAFCAGFLAEWLAGGFPRPHWRRLLGLARSLPVW